MGRLRDDYESPLMQGIAEEVGDLFGTPDACLFRHSAGDNDPITDPVWNEPTSTVRFKKFKVVVSWSNWQDDRPATEAGLDDSLDVQVHIALNHLLKSGVPLDEDGDYVSEGDVVGFHRHGEYQEFDVIAAGRVGFVNDSDKFTGYQLECKRREKYATERKTGDD